MVAGATTHRWGSACSQPFMFMQLTMSEVCSVVRRSRRLTRRLLALLGVTASVVLLLASSAIAEETEPDVIPPPKGIWFCYGYPTLTSPIHPITFVITSPLPIPERVATQEPHCPPP